MRALGFVVAGLGAVVGLLTLFVVSQADPAGPISVTGGDRGLIVAWPRGRAWPSSPAWRLAFAGRRRPGP